jgi:hypothetical protein
MTSVLSDLNFSRPVVDKPGVSTSFDDHPQAATILVPSASGNGAKRSIPCTFQGTEGRRLILEAGEPLSPSTALSIEHEDNLFLGEVMACAAQAPAVYRMEIKIEQILTGLHSLMALRARLLGESVPHPLALVPAGVLN